MKTKLTTLLLLSTLGIFAVQAGQPSLLKPLPLFPPLVPLLHKAIDNGDIETVKSLLDSRANIHSKYWRKEVLTAFMVSEHQKLNFKWHLSLLALLNTKEMNGVTYRVPDSVMQTVSVVVNDATYRVPDRAMQMELTITNNGDSVIRLGEFRTTAFIRFLDPDVAEDFSDYPDDLLAEEGLTVSDNSPLAPGETRFIEVTASGAVWEVYRLADLIYDSDSRFAGLLFFYSKDSDRYIAMVDEPFTPSQYAKAQQKVQQNIPVKSPPSINNSQKNIAQKNDTLKFDSHHRNKTYTDKVNNQQAKSRQQTQQKQQKQLHKKKYYFESANHCLSRTKDQYNNNFMFNNCDFPIAVFWCATSQNKDTYGFDCGRDGRYFIISSTWIGPHKKHYDQISVTKYIDTFVCGAKGVVDTVEWELEGNTPNSLGFSCYLSRYHYIKYKANN